MGWRDKGYPINGGPEGWRRYWRGGKDNWARSHRHPKTRQEMAAWDREYGRAKRSPARLPESYDDLMHSYYGNNSWKRYRASQYRST